MESQQPPTDETQGQGFGLERHLHEFLRDNWKKTELAADWQIYAEQGDPEQGYEFPTDIGRIDILARHRREGRWLVIELKRNESTDQTVGQVLRYMGWVREKLAREGECVRGLIICRQCDPKLHYALKAAPDVDVREYRVDFHLQPPSAP